MSNLFAIATVTQAIAQTLSTKLDEANVPGAHVTTLPPDAGTGLPETGVNIFLYQVSPNPSLRNADLPTRGADGALRRRPQVALDLDYLVTFYGDETKLERQRLLGVVARTLHAQPVLTRDIVEFVRTHVPFLAGSDLGEQPDLVRIAPIRFSLEELSKLWSFLLKVDYVLSVAYRAGVVLIETDDPLPPPPLPVLEPRVVALPDAQPVVTAVEPAAGPGPILPGGPIRVRGRGFVRIQSAGGGPVPVTTQVLVDGAALAPATLDATQITVALPADLAAGTHAIQVSQSLLLGTPAVPHEQGTRSGPALFVVHPVIRKLPAGGDDITVAAGGGSPPGPLLTVALEPPVRAGQRVLLELVPAAPAAAPAALFDGGTAAATTATWRFAVAGVAAGDYLVRIRVDGAESPFEVDAAGTPIAPQVAL